MFLKSKITFFFLSLSLFQISAQAREILVPAYFYPGPDWDRLVSAARIADITAIVNPANGPGEGWNPDYATAINRLRMARGKVIGYVNTDYGRRPIREVYDDLERYSGLYNIDGFFIDQMANDSEETIFGRKRINYYAQIYRHIKDMDPDFRVIANPGSNVPEVYLNRPCADIVVTFENSSGYREYRPEPWMDRYPGRFAHLVYGVSIPEQMREFAELAEERGINSLFVTDGMLPNPWNALPPYWDEEADLSRRWRIWDLWRIPAVIRWR